MFVTANDFAGVFTSFWWDTYKNHPSATALDKLFQRSLRFDHHSAIDNYRTCTQWPPHIINNVTCETCIVTLVVPPTTTSSRNTIARTMVVVVVVVVCWEHHSIVKVPANIAITIPVANMTQWISGVSAVAVQFQSIFVVELVTDLERSVLVTDLDWPVLGWEPQIGRILLHLHSQSVRLWTGKSMTSFSPRIRRESATV